MDCKYYLGKGLLILPVLMGLFLNQPTQANASGSLVVDGGHHRRYTEIRVGEGRYYYKQGIFYRGDHDRYVVMEAPVGAIVYSVPANYEWVDIDGVRYVRYRDTYYRRHHKGYEVVRIESSRRPEHNNFRGRGRRDHRNEQRNESTQGDGHRRN